MPERSPDKQEGWVLWVCPECGWHDHRDRVCPNRPGHDYVRAKDRPQLERVPVVPASRVEALEAELAALDEHEGGAPCLCVFDGNGNTIGSPCSYHEQLEAKLSRLIDDQAVEAAARALAGYEAEKYGAPVARPSVAGMKAALSAALAHISQEEKPRCGGTGAIGVGAGPNTVTCPGCPDCRVGPRCPTCRDTRQVKSIVHITADEVDEEWGPCPDCRVGP